MVTLSGHAREAGVTIGCLDYGLEQAALNTLLTSETPEAPQKLVENHSCLQSSSARDPDALARVFLWEGSVRSFSLGLRNAPGPRQGGPSSTPGTLCNPAQGSPHWLWLLLLPAAGAPQACHWERWGNRHMVGLSSSVVPLSGHFVTVVGDHSSTQLGAWRTFRRDGASVRHVKDKLKWFLEQTLKPRPPSGRPRCQEVGVMDEDRSFLVGVGGSPAEESGEQGAGSSAAYLSLPALPSLPQLLILRPQVGRELEGLPHQGSRCPWWPAVSRNHPQSD